MKLRSADRSILFRINKILLQRLDGKSKTRIASVRLGLERFYCEPGTAGRPSMKACTTTGT
jgi:hypothetical protein